MTSRKEQDTFGAIDVPASSLWGAGTERSRRNFTIGKTLMPKELIYSIAIIKKAAARANFELGVLPKEKCDLIVKGADEILSGKLDDQFPLVIFQTGSGTQTNMNVNEVIANFANVLAGGKLGEKSPIHPNDDVNKSQSTNDVFPSAIHVAATIEIQSKLLVSLKRLEKELSKKAEEFCDIIKVGRTHLMDAAPLSLGQEFSGYAAQIHNAILGIEATLPQLRALAIGGTAVGTGLNAPRGFALLMCKIISELTNTTFTTAENKFEALASHDAAVATSGALKRLSCALFKIANDIRFLASGPRAGLAEIFIPENEPGSSIMPGKVNPTQCEAMTMVALQVMGYDTTIGFAGASGHFELNVFKPLIGYNLLQSIALLHGAIESFIDHLVIGIRPNSARISALLENSLMLATALNPIVGYDKAAEIVKLAHKENISLKEAALKLGYLTSEQFDKAIDPKKMVNF
jgi:fumarate hydratase, class II